MTTGLWFYEKVSLCYKLLGDTLIFLKTILRNCGLSCQSFSEILWISEKDLNLSSVSQRTTNRNPWKLENRGLSWQSLSEILRFSEKVWTETHQNLTWMSQIEETSSKFKNQKRFLFRSRNIFSGQKNHLKISWDSPFNMKIRNLIYLYNRTADILIVYLYLEIQYIISSPWKLNFTIQVLAHKKYWTYCTVQWVEKSTTYCMYYQQRKNW